MAEQEPGLAQQVRPWVARHREDIDIGRRNPAHRQAGLHRLARKAGHVLDAPVALFLDRGDELAVAHQRRRHVAVIGVEPENIHEVTESSAR